MSVLTDLSSLVTNILQNIFFCFPQKKVWNYIHMTEYSSPFSHFFTFEQSQKKYKTFPYYLISK